jgi:spermidine/putrescine transport system substrate-binding protein
MARYRFLVLVLVALLVAACGNTSPSTSSSEYGSGADTSAQPTAAPAADATTVPAPANGAAGEVDSAKLSSELRFYNWTDYIDPTILEDFENEYGVKIILDNYDANEDMIAKVRAGGSGYDLVAPSDYAVQIMVADNLLAPLDKALLPNLVHADPGLLNKYFDEGNAYSVPYLYGLTGIAYNQQFFPEGVDSWAVLFDPAQAEKYTGQFSMQDDERETPGAALKYLGKSLNETDPAVLEQVRELLTAQKPLLAAYNSSDVNRKLASGEYVMAHAWSGMAMQARNGLGEEFSGNPDIKFVIPKEGGTIWMDNLAILADSPNAYTAHVFIDFLLRPEIAARNAEYVGYLTPNKDAVALLSEETKALYAEGFAPDEEMLARLEWIEKNDETAAFTDLWTAVKGE